jgi:hypothetical protein
LAQALMVLVGCLQALTGADQVINRTISKLPDVSSVRTCDDTRPHVELVTAASKR